MSNALQLATQTAVTAQSSWIERIVAAWQKQVPAILETGNLLLAAKDNLRGNWLSAAEEQLPFGISTANKLMKIAACDHFKDSELIPNLPASWGALFELSQLDADSFAKGIDDKTIHSKMKVIDAKNLRRIGPREPDVKKQSPMAILTHQVEEQNRLILHLKEQLAFAESGSTFDLKRDTVKDIVSVIVNDVRMGVITKNKALDIANELKVALRTTAGGETQ